MILRRMISILLQTQVKQCAGVALLTLALTSCTRNAGLPEAGSNQYRDFCKAFFIGLAGLESGEDVRAKADLTRATQIAPGEPAAWADLGIFQMRQQDFDGAFKNLETARSLAPESSRMEALLGLIESRRGKAADAIAHLQKAVNLDGRNLKALYSLAEEWERQGLAGSDAEAEKALDQILKIQPDNSAVLLEIARIASKQADAARLKQALATLTPATHDWPQAAQQQFTALNQTAAGANPRAAAVQVQFLRNVLLRVPSYRQSLDEVRTPPTIVAQPISRFLRLPVPSAEAAPSDTALHFESQSMSGVPATDITWTGAVGLNDQSTPAILWADSNQLHLSTGAVVPLPKSANAPPLAVLRALPTQAIAGADLNYDFKTDLIIATSSGIRIYRQLDPSHFADVTPEAKLPPAIVNGSYTGAWAFDFDLDGDLDIVLGVPEGEPLVLRNNGDDTFTPVRPFKGINGLVAFAAADIDSDGDPDVAAIDKTGRLIVFSNERLGDFRRHEVPASLAANNVALAAGDINGDGRLDFVVLRNDSTIVRLSTSDKAAGSGWTWDYKQLARAKQLNRNSGPISLHVADLDNNGALDIIAADQVFLNDGKSLLPIGSSLPANSQAAVDLNGDGRLDLIGLSTAPGHPVKLVQLTNHGTKDYRWQVVRTRAAHATGDQRINSFGIGGTMELRSDLFTQKQIITSPVLHFGLGAHTLVDFARIVWPNGSVQAEFEWKADQSVLAEQRIKGSCPMLFTWNGHHMAFQKDVGPWGSALGLNVNAQGKGVYGTREWFKISGDQLVPHDGIYDLRITAEYWETYYMDHYSLLVVDHPSNTDVFADERFALPPPPPGMIATANLKPFAHASDTNGRDVTKLVRDLDTYFLGTFSKGQYQGLACDHWVELELPPDAPVSGPLYLVGQGWIHDTDATIVKALSQNSRVAPQGMSIEVPNAAGNWVAVRHGLGFPKGRLKTVVLDLTGIFRPGVPRKLRLRTNLELYWNKLSWAAGVSDRDIKVQHLGLAAADLHYRGFSRITQANSSSPEVPNYDAIQESALKWHDQEGLCTRYGDVRELLTDIDDRFVITSPGDELRMRFSAPPPPPEGWSRDFILICDGWVKDGDYNSTFSKTISPLPYHGMTEYTVETKTLDEERAYRSHPSDWQTYQTRYVTPKYFEKALWDH